SKYRCNIHSAGRGCLTTGSGERQMIRREIDQISPTKAHVVRRSRVHDLERVVGWDVGFERFWSLLCPQATDFTNTPSSQISPKPIDRYKCTEDNAARTR